MNKADSKTTVAQDLLAALTAMQAHWHHMIGLSSPATWHGLNQLASEAIARANRKGVSRT